MTSKGMCPDCPCPGRRKFCGAACAAAALALLPAGLAAQGAPPDPGGDPRFETPDTRAALAPGTVKDYRKAGGFYLVADAAGIYAVTAICTHQGCKVRQEGQGFHCPCHDSEYDLQGAVTHGPARFPLKHLEVTEARPGGPLVVDRAKAVDVHARL
jgi:cytochrome b6-f complex iron-sulfur subunit